MKGLYIHIPFCVKKCEYCDFVSFPGCEDYFDAYLDALRKEMSSYYGTKVDTIFIGGGTPSVLSVFQIEKLCNAIKSCFVLGDNYEWTIEVNPGTVNTDKINTMLMCGINRVSVGVQSFNDAELKAIGRIHDSKTAYDTVVALNDAGFLNISIDLMESLPYQTPATFKKSLDIALSLPITHISVYSLIIEDGTPIKEKYDNGEYEMPDDDEDRDLYKYTGDFLSKNGFIRYEISNYAKENYQSKHNLKYWDCDEYIGIGVAAHSYLDGIRKYNTSDLEEYISGVTKVGEDVLTMRDKMGEFMMLGLRKICGINRNEFHNRFMTYPEKVWGLELDKFISLGLMKKDVDFFSLTDRGLDVSNSVMCEFV